MNIQYNENYEKFWDSDSLIGCRGLVCYHSNNSAYWKGVLISQLY
jgi:hypothetical protein